MPKLNQIIAVANGKKSRAQASLSEIHHKLQKAALLNGISRTYRPKDEDGEKFPSEKQLVQVNVPGAINDVANVLTDLWDVVATQDAANCIAKANIVVDGKPLLSNVAVTTLLFLEKQLADLHTLVEKLPTLDPAETWKFNDSVAAFASEPQETVKTKKVQKSIVLYEATKEHPAQVQPYTEDVLVGYWTQIKFSGAIPETRRQELLSRVRKLQDAVKAAREEANGIEAPEVKLGSPVFGYLFA